ncbi:MAG TPA: CHAT domain-containing protein [Pyrinomonadaceae bacterium]|nr:CHAT domain-containing protein [Pyrinomonadaceae bacterium]
MVTFFLLLGTPSAQPTKETPENAFIRLANEGLHLFAAGSPASLTKAIEKFESARVALRPLNLPVGDAVMLTMIGVAYSQVGQDQKAMEKYMESLPLYRIAGEQKGEASTLLHLGLIHTKLGEMEKGLDYLGQALALFHTAGERQGEAMALTVIGSLYVLLGKPEELITYYSKVLAISRSTAPRERDTTALPALAPLFKLMGQNVVDQPEKAREGLEQLLSLSRAFRIPRGQALALLGLGLDHSFEHETQKALSYYEQALPLFQSEHDRPGEGVALFGLCMSYISARDHKKGFIYCDQALALHRAIGDRHAESLTLKQIAIGERDRGDLAASLRAIESAIANVESIRTKVVNPELRLSFFAGAQDYYEFYIDLLMRLHKQHPNDGYNAKALHATERARARSLLDTLNEANADIRQGVDAALLQREQETQRRLNAKAQTQMSLVSQKHSEAQAKAIAEEIQALIKDLQQVETEIRQNSPQYAALMQPRPLTVREIQTQVLDQETVLLEYALGEERSFVWVVTSAAITSHELAKRSDIESAVAHFYNLLNARNADVKGETKEQRAVRISRSDAAIPLAAASLSRMVLVPEVGRTGKKRLVVVADGALHFIPFAALPVGTDGPTRGNQKGTVTEPRNLIADHEIVNLPSASTLAVIREEVAGRERAPKTVAVLADPVFMKTDERVKTEKNRSPPPRNESKKDRQLIKAKEDTGLSSGLDIPRLPGTRREAEQIVAMVPENERRLALDFTANREAATSAELAQYRYVHLSTHGLLNSVHPELSGLVFSLVNERGEPQDGFLLAHEIFNLKIPAEAVVLSACETGIGKDIKGEGLVSLTRGFMYAGSPRVVVSLWGVSDSATTELMVRFYQGMLKEGRPPAAALRAAQLSVMSDKRWASPYYWAPFVLQGEWR